ncbi:MAG: ornithine carbamoyltransferase, partial [Mucispirillum sp.]|nr:ornithine carbamoyltransferase [Mucispirillum sp.]
EPPEAVKNADVGSTEGWASMGQEDESKKRIVDFQGFQVDKALMEMASDKAVFMHCLPAHRGEEVAEEVLEGPASRVFDEAENRLHVQKAILIDCIGGI